MFRKFIGAVTMLSGAFFGVDAVYKVIKSMDFTNINTTTNAATFIFCVLLIIVGYKIFTNKMNNTEK